MCKIAVVRRGVLFGGGHYVDGTVDLDGKPAAGSLGHFLLFEIEQARNAGSREIDIEDSNVVALLCQGEGELDCDGGFADASFTGEDEDDVPDILEAHRWV